MVDGACVDVDECAVDSPCDSTATCANSEGGFKCTCPTGSFGNGKKCFDIDECRDGTHGCPAQSTCINLPASFECSCESGYEMIDESCVDINECEIGAHDCSENASCENTEGE